MEIRWLDRCASEVGLFRLILKKRGQYFTEKSLVSYSEVGMQEAVEAGKKLEFTPIDVVFCSQMDRARATVSLALSVHSSKKTPVVQHNSPLEFPTFEGVNDQNPYDFVGSLL